MKKILLTLGAAFLLTAGVQAQSGLGYGIKAGVNIPSYNYGGSDISESKSTVNFHVIWMRLSQVTFIFNQEFLYRERVLNLLILKMVKIRSN
jgi:hypothetical protein